jgi:predicted Rossmann-fold nucleotide-binding protein
MLYKIGIFGSASGGTNEIIKKAQKIGKILAKNNCLIINGACNGLPYEAAKAGYENGAKVWSYSPAYDLKEQKRLIIGNDNRHLHKNILHPKKF